MTMPDLAEKLADIKNVLYVDRGHAHRVHEDKQGLQRRELQALTDAFVALLDALAASHRDCMRSHIPGNSKQLSTTESITSRCCNSCEKCRFEPECASPPAPLLYTAAQVQERVEEAAGRAVAQEREAFARALARKGATFDRTADRIPGAKFEPRQMAGHMHAFAHEVRQGYHALNFDAAIKQVIDEAVSEAVAKEREAWRLELRQLQAGVEAEPCIGEAEQWMGGVVEGFERVITFLDQRSRGGEG